MRRRSGTASGLARPARLDPVSAAQSGRAGTGRTHTCWKLDRPSQWQHLGGHGIGMSMPVPTPQRRLRTSLRPAAAHVLSDVRSRVGNPPRRAWAEDDLGAR